MQKVPRAKVSGEGGATVSGRVWHAHTLGLLTAVVLQVVQVHIRVAVHLHLVPVADGDARDVAGVLRAHPVCDFNRLEWFTEYGNLTHIKLSELRTYLRHDRLAHGRGGALVEGVAAGAHDEGDGVQLRPHAGGEGGGVRAVDVEDAM